MEAAEPHTFVIYKGQQTERLQGRRKAVHQAKQTSASFGGPVRVERDDRRVEMIFSRGNLTKYQYTTRGR